MREERSEPGLREFTSEFLQELYNLDRGVPGTWLALFKRPELVVEDYFGKGTRFMNPFRYTLFVGSVVTLLASLFDYGAVFSAAQVATFSLLSMPIAAITGNYALVGWIFSPLFFAYMIWVYYRNFGGSGWKRWSRILFSVLVGYVFMLIAIMIFQYSLAAILFFW